MNYSLNNAIHLCNVSHPNALCLRLFTILSCACACANSGKCHRIAFELSMCMVVGDCACACASELYYVVFCFVMLCALSKWILCKMLSYIIVIVQSVFVYGRPNSNNSSRRCRCSHVYTSLCVYVCFGCALHAYGCNTSKTFKRKTPLEHFSTVFVQFICLIFPIWKCICLLPSPSLSLLLILNIFLSL